jgi:ABC-type polysaccharide/polyol phosphate transport system ATPase subunit
MTSIELIDASLAFRVRQQGRTQIKDILLRRLFLANRNPWVYINALQNINLHIREGERIGLMGHNGAGKSTLLKVMAGIYPVTSGDVTVQGHIHSMLDIGVGIELEANGWDNMMYRCLVQGDTPKQAREKADAIAEFSELGDALKRPIKSYSSGMIVRLLFSIATTVVPEILLVDEILGVGDASFQEKVHQRIMELIDRCRILFVASHDPKTLARLCNRVLWLDHGTIVQDGKPEVLIPAYEDFMKKDFKAAA